MTLTVNGEAKTVAEGLTLAQFVRELGLERNPIAIELNRQVVPRDRHGETRLAEGDRLEIVTLVGGG
ncbi:MAG TPA: sulfur carrier protein ThiS [Planctomycetota bacterium]|nr:sulfur carrier protein ThiS [Planctomycetota bacterium]